MKTARPISAGCSDGQEDGDELGSDFGLPSGHIWHPGAIADGAGITGWSLRAARPQAALDQSVMQQPRSATWRTARRQDDQQRHRPHTVRLPCGPKPGLATPKHACGFDHCARPVRDARTAPTLCHPIHGLGAKIPCATLVDVRHKQNGTCSLRATTPLQKGLPAHKGWETRGRARSASAILTH